MERLTGLDASFLYNETPTVHMHTLKVAIFDPSSVMPDPSFEWIRSEIGRRLHLLPPLRRRLVEVPLGFHHPVWIEDPDLDLAYHVRRVTIPAPGTRLEMDEVIAEIAGWPLDRRRPLWQMFVLEGFADGRIGVLVKVHHAVADGVAAAQLLENVMSTSPGPVEPASEAEAGHPEAVPGRWELLGGAVKDRLRLVGRLPQLLWITLLNVLGALRIRRGARVRLPRPLLDAPKTSFNLTLTPHRSFATTQLPFTEVRRVSRAHGVTVNDVVLAMVGGALRRYLDARGELPEKSLVASVPTSIDAPGTVRLAGNRVSSLITTTGSAIEDPLERMRYVHEVTTVARRVNEALGPEMMEDWVEHTPPRIYAWLVRQYGRRRLADWHRPAVNLVVSNVPGPREPLYVAGAPLIELYSVGPVLEGIGLNVTVWSYMDQLCVGALACREAVPDVRQITDRLQESLEEMTSRSQGVHLVDREA